MHFPQTFFQTFFKSSLFSKKYFLFFALFFLTLIVTATLFFTIFSPLKFTFPTSVHEHFRLQIINNNQRIDFATSDFQEIYDPNICSVTITDEPMHFHDNLDELVHLHWDQITGADLLKYYGWNFKFNLDHFLALRLDHFPSLKPVFIHGQVLGERPALDHLHIYLKTNHTSEYSFQKIHPLDFLNTNITDLFDHQPLLLSNFFKIVLAHDEKNKTTANTTKSMTMGDLVIFTQTTAPTEIEIKQAFENFKVEAQGESCGG